MGVWGFLLSGVVALIASLTVAVVPGVVVRASRATAVREAPTLGYPADSLERVAVARDLFRTDRRPAALAYDPARGAAPLPDGPPKPQLLLTGIVWGDEPEAVIEGLPSATGPRVVRTGDSIGGVTIKRIEPSRLIATGFDTTWTLTVRVPWK